MNLFCYTFSFVYILYCVYKQLWQYMIEWDLLRLKHTTYIVSGYTVYSIQYTV